MVPQPAPRSIRLLLAGAAMLGLAGSALALARAGDNGPPRSSTARPSQAQVLRDDPGDVSASPTSTTNGTAASHAAANSTNTAPSTVPVGSTSPVPTSAPVPPSDPAPEPELTPALFPVPPVEWVPVPPVECVPAPPIECATSALAAAAPEAG